MFILTLALTAPVLHAQEPVSHHHVRPWIGLGLGGGAAAAKCGCEGDVSGLTFDGMFGAGMDLTNRVSLGYEYTGFVLVLVDAANLAHFHMAVARLQPTHIPLAARIGFGIGSYKQGSAVLVNNRPAGVAGLELSWRRRGIEAANYLDVYEGLPGAARQGELGQPVRFRVVAAHAGLTIRVHFGG